MSPNKSHLLLDHLIAANGLKNDAALSRLLEVAPPVISKIRHRALRFGDSLVLRVHDITEMPVREILALRKQVEEADARAAEQRRAAHLRKAA